jgi:hypothetical protein
MMRKPVIILVSAAVAAGVAGAAVAVAASEGPAAPGRLAVTAGMSSGAPTFSRTGR